jgi:hypothetical protein
METVQCFLEHPLGNGEIVSIEDYQHEIHFKKREIRFNNEWMYLRR